MLEKKFANEIGKYYESKLKKEIIPGRDYIPASGKVFDAQELIYGVESVLDAWWTYGRFSAEFEKKLGKFLGVKNAMIVNSGSSANLLAFSALASRLLGAKALKKGDEVITAAAAFPTTVNPIIQAGCLPVFVDVELGNYNAAADSVGEAITEKTKAIFLAHALGNPFDLAGIKKIAEEKGLWLIEDSCDALGSEYGGRMTGSFGDAATFSFYPAHHITMGEGGAVVSNDDLVAKAAMSLRDWGRDCYCLPGKDNSCGKRFSQQHGKLPFGYDHKYVYSHAGYNLKGTDMQAAIGLAQLEKLGAFIEKRKKNFAYLSKIFREFEGVFHLPEKTRNSEPSWFGFPLTIREGSGISRKELTEFLERNKIGTRLLFGGNITRQPYFAESKIDFRVSGSLRNTDAIAENCFWLGLYPALGKEHFDYVHETVSKFLKGKK